MSEVHRYLAVKMQTDVGNNISYTPHGPEIVLAEHFDRVTAERDALQQRLTAADERADVLEGLVGEVLDAVGREPLDLDAVLRLRARMRAALKPAEPAKCNACGGRGSVCVDWDSGAWSDCQECTKP
ncbi:hypothetical protein HBO38_08940 [Pseudomonas veronii]|uniref:Uncharacterized protein n=1 Tax=Pseudomonas veronii TaxID=76761 RepID=A0A7Y1F8Q2_PSEVE|nr:hypothetical protein [Pseudomonas veronii]NMY08572.1 hypothetical protein [Pseudomonas veronii]